MSDPADQSKAPQGAPSPSQSQGNPGGPQNPSPGATSGQRAAETVQTTGGSDDRRQVTAADEVRLAQQRAADEEQRQRDINDSVAAASAKAREEFENSEQGAIAREHREAERIMRLPTPDALRELGAVVGDPTRGPSS